MIKSSPESKPIKVISFKECASVATVFHLPSEDNVVIVVHSFLTAVGLLLYKARWLLSVYVENGASIVSIFVVYISGFQIWQ